MNQEGSPKSVWYLSRSGKQFGPISDPELHRLAELRRLRVDDLLWKPGFESWRAANTFPGLLPTPTPEVQAALDGAVKRERPLGIVLISIYFAVGAVGCFIQGVIDALLAGLGTQFLIGALVYVLLSCLSLATAYGLWTFQRWGRRLAIAICTIGVLVIVVSVVVVLISNRNLGAIVYVSIVQGLISAVCVWYLLQSSTKRLYAKQS
ncbi:MAG: DUF4339 domain-containing protein [Methyloceanibacter sp.]